MFTNNQLPVSSNSETRIGYKGPGFTSKVRTSRQEEFKMNNIIQDTSLTTLTVPDTVKQQRPEQEPPEIKVNRTMRLNCVLAICSISANIAITAALLSSESSFKLNQVFTITLLAIQILFSGPFIYKTRSEEKSNFKSVLCLLVLAI